MRSGEGGEITARRRGGYRGQRPSCEWRAWHEQCGSAIRRFVTTTHEGVDTHEVTRQLGHQRLRAHTNAHRNRGIHEDVCVPKLILHRLPELRPSGLDGHIGRQAPSPSSRGLICGPGSATSADAPFREARLRFLGFIFAEDGTRALWVPPNGFSVLAVFEVLSVALASAPRSRIAPVMMMTLPPAEDGLRGVVCLL